MAADIQPGLVVETGGIDDESVSLPFANGVAHPGWVRIFRMLPSIGENLAHVVFVFEVHNRAARDLEEFNRVRVCIDVWNTRREATKIRVVGGQRSVFASDRMVTLEFFCSPGCEWKGVYALALWIGPDEVESVHRRRIPNSS